MVKIRDGRVKNYNAFELSRKSLTFPRESFTSKHKHFESEGNVSQGKANILRANAKLPGGTFVRERESIDK